MIRTLWGILSKESNTVTVNPPYLQTQTPLMWRAHCHFIHIRDLSSLGYLYPQGVLEPTPPYHRYWGTTVYCDTLEGWTEQENWEERQHLPGTWWAPSVNLHSNPWDWWRGRKWKPTKLAPLLPGEDGNLTLDFETLGPVLFPQASPLPGGREPEGACS